MAIRQQAQPRSGQIDTTGSEALARVQRAEAGDLGQEPIDDSVVLLRHQAAGGVDQTPAWAQQLRGGTQDVELALRHRSHRRDA